MSDKPAIDREVLLSDIELNLMGASPGLHNIGYRAYHKIMELDSENKAIQSKVDELLEKQDNLRKALEFFDRVKNSSSENERIAVGTDHYDWLISAARDMCNARIEK